MDLAATLKRVSQNCLRGQPVPADLRRLWQAQLEGDSEVLDAADLVLVDALAPDFFEGYRVQDRVPPEYVRGYGRMFEQIAFIGQDGGGALLGYWLGEGHRPVGASPIVELDNEGQFGLLGADLSQALMMRAENRMGFSEARAWLEACGLVVGVSSQEDIWHKLETFPDPNAQADRYIDEEQAKGGGS